nr:PREDICTED: formin-like protein 6 [Bemisia tabaci]
MCGYLLFYLVLFSLSSYDNAAPTKQNYENPETLSPVQLQSPEFYPTAVVLQPTNLDKETGQIYSSTNPTPEIHLQERFLCLPSFKRRNNNAGNYKGRKLRPSASNSNSKRKRGGRRPNSSPPPESPKSPIPTVVTTPGPVSGPRGPPSPPSPGHPSTWKNHGDHAMYYQPPNYPYVHVIPYKEDPLDSLTNSMHRATWAS